jgi:hypothetical protein
MGVEVGTVAWQFLAWEYLFQFFVFVLCSEGLVTSSLGEDVARSKPHLPNNLLPWMSVSSYTSGKIYTVKFKLKLVNNDKLAPRSCLPWPFM